MHLESTRAQTVRISALDLAVDFAEGERIHTENSYKYDLGGLLHLAAATGFRSTNTGSTRPSASAATSSSPFELNDECRVLNDERKRVFSLRFSVFGHGQSVLLKTEDWKLFHHSALCIHHFFRMPHDDTTERTGGVTQGTRAAREPSRC